MNKIIIQYDKINKLYTQFSPDEKGIVRLWDVCTKLLLYISPLEVIIASYKRLINYKKEDYSKILEKIKNNCTLSHEEELLHSKIEKLYSFIEVWVAFHTYLAILLSLLIFYTLSYNEKVIIYLITYYGGWRVFEIIIKQIRVIMIDTIGKKAISIKSARRSIIMLIHNIAEMIFWFACSFMSVCVLEPSFAAKGYVHLSDLYRWSDFIRCSTLQFTTFGDSYTVIGLMMQGNTILINITFWEIMIGFIIIVISIGRFFSMLPSKGDQVS